MTVVELSPNLVKPLRRLAKEQDESVDEIIGGLVADYLREQRHAQLLVEMERYRVLHPQIVEQYEGQYVAVYQGEVVDHDEDTGVLFKRVYERYGDLPVLIVRVTREPDQVFRRLHRHVVQ